MNMVILALVTTMVVGCGADGKGASGSSKISKTFSDSSVTSFTQTSGIAKTNQEKLMNLIISSAYAATGSISCLSGESVSFDVDTTIGSTSNTTTVNTTCSENIDLDIRRGLLEGLDQMAIYRTATDASYKKGLLNFKNTGAVGSFQWSTNYQVKTLATPCYDVYSFNKTNGTVTIKPDFANNAGCLCDDANKGDPNHGSYNADCKTVSASFRFINGTMELDLTGSANFNSSLTTYEKWEECTSLADQSTCN